MTRLDNPLVYILLAALVAVTTWRGVVYYGGTQYDAGHDAAIAAGKKQHDIDVAAALKTETDLRAQLQAKDEEARESERTYEISLEVAQRRVRDGTDRLRCPAANPVQPAAAAEDRPAAGGSAVDGGGTDLVSEAAADVLGDGATAAGLVRKYDRLTQRFEACRALNATP